MTNSYKDFQIRKKNKKKIEKKSKFIFLITFFSFFALVDLLFEIARALNLNMNWLRSKRKEAQQKVSALCSLRLFVWAALPVFTPCRSLTPSLSLPHPHSLTLTLTLSLLIRKKERSAYNHFSKKKLNFFWLTFSIIAFSFERKCLKQKIFC